MKLLFEYNLKKRKEIWKAINEDKAFRLKYFEYDFYAFAIYYFGHNFITWIKDFHKAIYWILTKNTNAIIIGFRESWKTAIVALFYVVWIISYRKQKFILFMAYDLDSATDKVLNISNFLKSNKKFKSDFWLLFDDWRNKKKDEFNAQKRMSKFISTTWVKVEAVSLKNMKRWKQLLNEEWEVIRPDLLIADDIDTDDSIRNIRIIDETEAKILSWVLKSLRGKAIFLWNIIAEDWIIQRLEKTFKDHWYTMRIALIENWNIIWPERYVWNEEEAKKINKEKYWWEKIVQSIEELSIDEQSFNSDFLNIPKIIIWDSVFNINKLREINIVKPYFVYDIRIEDRDIQLEIFYKDFQKDFYDYLYAWIDTGWGWGWESDSTDLCFLDKDWKLYAKVNSNILTYKHTQKLLSILCSEYWFAFFKNSLCIERNHLWVALIEEIKEKDIALFKDLYISKTLDKKITKYTNSVGWITTQTSKEKLKEDLNEAINLWKIELSQEEFIEFKSWIKEEIWEKIIYCPDSINSKHDDRIIWRWLAFQMFLTNNKNYLDGK